MNLSNLFEKVKVGKDEFEKKQYLTEIHSSFTNETFFPSNRLKKLLDKKDQTSQVYKYASIISNIMEEIEQTLLDDYKEKKKSYVDVKKFEIKRNYSLLMESIKKDRTFSREESGKIIGAIKFGCNYIFEDLELDDSHIDLINEYADKEYFYINMLV
jgi:hypothetical protein